MLLLRITAKFYTQASKRRMFTFLFSMFRHMCMCMIMRAVINNLRFPFCLCSRRTFLSSHVVCGYLFDTISSHKNNQTRDMDTLDTYWVYIIYFCIIFEKPKMFASALKMWCVHFQYRTRLVGWLSKNLCVYNILFRSLFYDIWCKSMYI